MKLPICSTCGGHDILLDAYAAWDPLKDEWVLNSTHENPVCETCKGECSWEFQEVTEPTLKHKITHIHVYWSESREFKLEHDYWLTDFERIAARVARSNLKGMGYDKTKIRVHWQDGQTYECRLDLCEPEDHGFIHHIKDMLQTGADLPGRAAFIEFFKTHVLE